MHIDILDYGVGNIGSVVRMVEKVGGSVRVITTAQEILNSSKLILPGVGHFDQGMREIMRRGFLEPLRTQVLENGIPLIGICLGMQLLCKGSEEGILPGLSFVNAQVKRFTLNGTIQLKVPHIGWQYTDVVRDNPLINDSVERQRFYYAHSYYVVPCDSNLTIATVSHGSVFCAALRSGNIFGVQFHPEKSHRFGMSLIKNFGNI